MYCINACQWVHALAQLLPIDALRSPGLPAVGGGPELLLLRGLASQSLVYVPWFWSSAFMAALATAAAGQEARHLQKQHQQQQQDGQERGTAPGAAEEPKGTCHNLLAACAAEFAVYMAGVGLPGEERGPKSILVLQGWCMMQLGLTMKDMCAQPDLHVTLLCW
jgi:hypothetical protein